MKKKEKLTGVVERVEKRARGDRLGAGGLKMSVGG